MAVMARESWTDERLDHLSERMDERFDRVDAEIKLRFERVDERFTEVDRRLGRVEGDLQEVRVALRDLHDDNRAMNRVMTQGFIAITGAIATGCVLIAGAAAF
jgi:septation ring formation regulator EzrA